MAIMPTTRRGRFLFYKQRARRRLARVYDRAKRVRTELSPEDSPPVRRHDVSGYGKQAPRVYPRHFGFKDMTAAEWLDLGWTPPTRERWGVARGWSGALIDRPAWMWGNGTTTGYYDRRVKRVPRLSHVPLLPWNRSQDGLVAGMVYPFEFYPSGRRSYASLQGWA